MEYFFHIKPAFDCAVKAQNLSTHLQSNKIHSFLLNTSQTILPISFFPTNSEYNTSLNFTVVVNLKTKCLNSKMPNVDLINFPNDNILLIAREFFIANPKPFSIQSKTFNFSGISHNFFYSKNSPFSMRIENASHEFLDADYPKRIQELNFKTSKNSLFCYGKTFQDSYVVCIIKHKDHKYSLTTLEEVDLLEVGKDKIITFKRANDMLGHAFTKEYTFSPNLGVETNLVYDENENVLIHKKEIVPYAFFDAVKTKDFDLARTYLTEELGAKLSDKHLGKFFGEFLFSHQSLSKNSDEIALIYDDENSSKIAKIFSISQDENDKISNILQV
ncbi:MAG: hypothetical protein EOM55_01355 [Clostridia bacterium]|nr:hypothetical protein [Clostridia bacterium]